MACASLIFFLTDYKRKLRVASALLQPPHLYLICFTFKPSKSTIGLTCLIELSHVVPFFEGHDSPFMSFSMFFPFKQLVFLGSVPSKTFVCH